MFYKKGYIIVIGLSVLVFVVVLLQWTPTRNALDFIASPFFTLSHTIGVMGKTISSTIFAIPYNIDEIRSLRVENSAYRARIALSRELERENKILKSVLGRMNKRDSLVYARVVFWPLRDLHDYIHIDVGSEHGIKERAVVLASGYMYIGMISEATSGSARVTLLSDVDEKTEVYFPDAGISSVAEGVGLGAMHIRVPAGIQMEEGDPIFSVGARDYLVGYIEEIESTESGAFQIIKTHIPVSIYDIRTVFVVTP
jgi:cell shape-determining protein MreC